MTALGPDVLGALARDLDDLVSAHFSVGELTDYRGWWPQDVVGEAIRYDHLCDVVLEPARAILGVPMRGISGARWLENNKGGRASSMHLPPVQRAAAGLRFGKEPQSRRGAALDFIPGGGLACDRAYWILDAAQRDGCLPPGGLFWYAPSKAHPGPASGRFVHIDFRPTGLARERALTPTTGRP